MQRKNISTKIQIRTFVLLALIWVAGFTVLFILGHWIAAIGVILSPFAIEYTARCVKAKKVIIPHREKLPVKTPEIAPNLITSISVLTVHQFIRCYAFNELNILGTGSHKQIKDCWNDLLGQYHAAIKNESMMTYIKLTRKKMAIELRKQIADRCCNVLKVMYSRQIADSLHKAFPNFTFSLDTLEKDIKQLQIFLVSEKREHDRITKELAALNTGAQKTQTPEEKEEDITDTLIEIRKFTNTNYDENTMNMLTYCRCLTKLHRHYENLKAQNNNG
jgi:hypothetical protein